MKRPVIPTALLISAAFALTACGGGGSDTASADAAQPVEVVVDGVATISAARLGNLLRTVPVEPLSVAEQTSLVFMREEEKLARDVYVYLDSLWGASVPTFSNIARSEATHMASVLTLLQRYALSDPAAATGLGQFSDPRLQVLYDQLVAGGSVSLVEALKVGAAIEEIDIIDLQAALALIDNRDIRLVYESLVSGSRNHLQAFVWALQQQGVVYTPQYLTPADYAAIVGS
ncbi:MAG: DUF2202 domain-containing protein [Zoogloea sp.]|jgi:hypothetical protein|uniref:DUF2202 domain-containing protein n=1 Tax=Zoogloea sp. TaxID=49181 RepID=UPI00262506B2|nr:DUF2202 domain-containing protein [Zoogloea sp.]MDD3327826.1 DUF2202 domain-containing protein [Zoogloea sp.]